ncbi:hypothetical protein [Eisenibacter elegans]|jgi:hypothetical protein|uniref:hypothetical protein n=1 Tax=Eisenibacter elegans TaxID=997 RepID=UPI0004157B33|nr:hypothetical protein [Eisenibacter elegans]
MSDLQSIYQGDYFSATFNSAEGILYTCWTTAYDMGEEAYREVVLSYVSAILQTKPRGVYLDARTARFPVTPELQHWIGEVVQEAATAVGLARVAYITSQDFIVQLSLEQIMDETQAAQQNQGHQVVRQLFSSPEDGLEWLKR